MHCIFRIQSWIDAGGCPETTTSESGSICSHRHAGVSSREFLERVPLLPAHSSGTLKHPTSSSDTRSLCSDTQTNPRQKRDKKGSCGSLIDTDSKSAKDTVIRIPNNHLGNDIQFVSDQKGNVCTFLLRLHFW